MAGSASSSSGRFALIELALHGLLYVFLFLCAAFIARRNFVRRRQDIQESVQQDEGGKDQGEQGFSAAISEGAKELSDFIKDPIPFVLETSAADSDTVQYRAGLEARLYLHVLWSLMKLFAVLAGVSVLVILPINVLTSRFVIDSPFMQFKLKNSGLYVYCGLTGLI
jgi:hypothetical protein